MEKDELGIKIPGTEKTRFINRVVLTGNKAVDCVQAAIKFHQDNYIPLRTISLIPSWYERFFAYMDKANYKRTGEHLSGDAILCIFDVDIKKGTALQKSEMYFEHYFTSRDENATAYFGPEAKNL
jgi:hypothetical protein